MSDDGDTKPYTTRLPTIWRGRDGATLSSSPVVHPDEMDPLERELATQRIDTCGTCKYFELGHGQAQMKAQRFLERLVREDNWQVKHLVSPANELGICGAHSAGLKGEEQMLTGKLHKACDQYRPTNGLVSITRRTTDGG